MFIFLKRLRFPSKLSIAELLRKRYGDRILKVGRNFEKTDIKNVKPPLFLTRLRFPSKPSTAEVLRKRYGHRILKLVRKVEKTDIKNKKRFLDLQFLKICEDHNVI